MDPLPNAAAQDGEGGPRNMNEAAAAAAVEEADDTISIPLPDPTMILTEQEVTRSLEIKTAVEEDDRVRNLTDFVYAQYALTTENETMEKILNRVYMMQCFCDEYKIQDALDDGSELVHQYAQQQPGLIIDFQKLQTHSYLTVEDFAKLNPRAIKTWEDFRTFTGGSFYIMQARQPNFAAIREGMTTMVECMDATFFNFDARFTEKYQHEFFRHYPHKLKESFLLNSPTVVNVFMALMKRFLPTEMTKAIHLGHQVDGLDGTRLDLFYNTPSPEAAQQNMVRKVLEALLLRYHNQRGFSLTRV